MFVYKRASGPFFALPAPALFLNKCCFANGLGFRIGALDSVKGRAQHRSYTNEWPATALSPTIRLIDVD
jgi:hypothetical protein